MPSPRSLEPHDATSPTLDRAVRAVVAVAILAVTLTPVLLSAVALSAPPASASPGVPDPPVPTYVEDFENKADNALVGLDAYTGAGPLFETYTADAPWLPASNACNGIILSPLAPTPNPNPSNGCDDPLGYPAVKDLARLLGAFAFAQGETPTDTSATNDAVTAWTNAHPGPDQLQIRTAVPIAVTAGHYYTVAADAIAASCFASHPLWNMSIISGAVTTPVNTTPLDVCVDYQAEDVATGTRMGTLSAPLPLRATGADMSIQIVNAQGSGSGNDGAFDNFRLIDVTPQLDKSYSPAAVAPGGTTRLTFTVTNSSDLFAKAGWDFSDSLPAGLVVAAAPNVTTDCDNGTVTATAGSSSIAVAGDLAAGDVSCTASVDVTASSTLSSPSTLQNCPADVTVDGLYDLGACVPLTVDARVRLLKTGTVHDANGNGRADVGETIDYRYAVTNDGAVPLSPISIADPHPGLSAVSCPASVAPGLTVLCTASYVLTVADLDAGTVVDTATATGTPPSGPPVVSTPSTATTPLVAVPAISLVKSAAPSVVSGPGERVTYSFLVTNTGNVTLGNVAVADLPAAPAGPAPSISCPVSSLAAGASTTCTATYTATQADVDHGRIDNTASASGRPPTGSPVDSPPSTATVIASRTPSISIEKSGAPEDVDGDGRIGVGDRIRWSFDVVNTGNVTLTAVTVVDPDAGEVNCPVSTLAPGAATRCHAVAPRVVSAGDVGVGSVVNTATVAGDDPTGTHVSSTPDTARVPVAAPTPQRTPRSATTPTPLAATGGHSGDLAAIGLVILGLGLVVVGVRSGARASRRQVGAVR